jgi:hypothetical protein
MEQNNNGSSLPHILDVRIRHELSGLSNDIKHVLNICKRLNASMREQVEMHNRNLLSPDNTGLLIDQNSLRFEHIRLIEAHRRLCATYEKKAMTVLTYICQLLADSIKQDNRVGMLIGQNHLSEFNSMITDMDQRVPLRNAPTLVVPLLVQIMESKSKYSMLQLRNRLEELL